MDGVTTTAYFASDFTLAEIKTLRAVQSSAARSKAFDGLYSIPTLDEVIALVKAEGAKAGRTVGIYPEIKHSTFHSDVVGFGRNVFEDKLVATLHAAYGNVADGTRVRAVVRGIQPAVPAHQNQHPARAAD
jgi:glycerophosphoryl diester phosphodiesterase